MTTSGKLVIVSLSIMESVAISGKCDRSQRGARRGILQLSVSTGISVATIKYYVRAGLLPPGEPTAPNQAQYGEGHVARLGVDPGFARGRWTEHRHVRWVFVAMETHRPAARPDYLTLAVGAVERTAGRRRRRGRRVRGRR